MLRIGVLGTTRGRAKTELVGRIERSEIKDARNDKPGYRQSASLRAFTPVFDGLWTRVNARMALFGLHAGD
jgi:hypothetical protein